MPSTRINSISTPESTGQPVVHEDLRRLAEAIVVHEVMDFANAAERTAAFAELGITPSPGALSFLRDVKRYEWWDAASWALLTPHRDMRQLTSVTASVTFTGIPSQVRTLQLTCTVRGDDATTLRDLRLRIGGDTGASYRYAVQFSQNGVAGIGNGVAQTSILVAYLPTAGSPAGVFGTTRVDISGWDEPHADHLTVRSAGGYMDTAANHIVANAVGAYTGTNPYTSLTLLPSAGSFVAGSQFHLLGWE